MYKRRLVAVEIKSTVLYISFAKVPDLGKLTL